MLWLEMIRSDRARPETAKNSASITWLLPSDGRDSFVSSSAAAPAGDPGEDARPAGRGRQRPATRAGERERAAGDRECDLGMILTAAVALVSTR